MVWIIFGIVALVVAGFVLLYNRLVKAHNRTENAWGQIDVQLQRRHDLIPNLVETVGGYADHERETLEQVVAARDRAVSAEGPREQAEAENLLTGALRQLFALAEDYPELEASANFEQLQRSLEEAEDRLAIARQIYNDTVLTYNDLVKTIPSNVVAAIGGFGAREYFDAPEDVDEVPRVDF